MNQVFKKVYEKYKKANTDAKKKMVISYGFKSEAEFLTFLGADSISDPNIPLPTDSKKKKRVVVGTPPVLHNVYILDASGSMAGGKIRSALSGINEEIQALQKHPDAKYTTQTITDFSGSGDVQLRTWKTPIKDEGEFNCKTRGLTALLEAIGMCLTRLLREHKDGEKVLVKIFTDGEENNSSSEWAGAVVPNLIKDCEAKGFVITFVGTSNDVAHAVKVLHVKQSNTLVHDNTAEGVTKSFKKSIGATVSYRAATTKGTDTLENFFTDSND